MKNNFQFPISNFQRKNKKFSLKKYLNSQLTTHDSQLITGFSLIELVIAMAIIAIIAGALWGNFFTSLAKGRDSRRKQDLDSIAKGLELYYTDNKVYPTALPAWGSTFAHQSNSFVVYMQKVPADPASPNANYCYVSDGSYYKIYANLENRDDPKILSPTATCDSTGYNYGIASSNTTP